MSTASHYRKALRLVIPSGARDLTIESSNTQTNQRDHSGLCEILHSVQDDNARLFVRFCNSALFFICQHQTSDINHQTFPTKNGLCAFSSPTLVIGPCPGQMIVSSGNVKILSRLFRIASW